MTKRPMAGSTGSTASSSTASTATSVSAISSASSVTSVSSGMASPKLSSGYRSVSYSHAQPPSAAFQYPSMHSVSAAAQHQLHLPVNHQQQQTGYHYAAPPAHVPRTMSVGYVSQLAPQAAPLQRPKSLYSMGQPASMSSPALLSKSLAPHPQRQHSASPSAQYHLTSDEPRGNHARTMSNPLSKPDRYHRRRSMVALSSSSLSPSRSPSLASDSASTSPSLDPSGALPQPPLSPPLSPSSAPLTASSSISGSPSPEPAQSSPKHAPVETQREYLPKPSPMGLPSAPQSIRTVKSTTPPPLDLMSHSASLTAPPQLVLPSDARRSSASSGRSVSSPVVSQSQFALPPPRPMTPSSSGSPSPIHSRSPSSSSLGGRSTPIQPQSILKKSQSHNDQRLLGLTKPAGNSTGHLPYRAQSSADLRSSPMHTPIAAAFASRTPSTFAAPSPSALQGSAKTGPVLTGSAKTDLALAGSAKTGPVIRDIRPSAQSADRPQPSYTAAPPRRAVSSPLPSPTMEPPSPVSSKLSSRLRSVFGGFSSKKKRVVSESVATGPLTGNGPSQRAVDSDTRSLFSIRSTSSTASFATLRKIGSSTKSLFASRHSSSRSMSMTSNSFYENSAPPAPTPGFKAPELTPLNAGSKRLSSSISTPVVTHAVAEADLPAAESTRKISLSGTSGSSSSSASLATLTTLTANAVPATTVASYNAEPQDALPSPVTTGYDSEKIPSLTSSTESSNESEEVVEDLAAGDTVFPKNLDLLNVESIRSSLERTKSLERRRSRRSTRSTRSNRSDHSAGDQADSPQKAEDSNDESGVPNATEVHVSEDVAVALSRTPSLSSSGPSKSILKSPHDSFDEEHVRELNDVPTPRLSQSEAQKAKRNSFLDDNSFLSEFSSAPQLSFDFDIDQESGRVDRKTPSPPIDDLRSLPSLHEVIAPSRQPAVYNAAGSYQSPASDDSINSSKASPPQAHSQTYYHPIYQKRMSLHARTSSRESNMSASSGRTPRRGGLDLDGRPHPGSPSKTGTGKNTVSFSSRIIIYDTYGRGDYDRRPEIATCNRLTPVLAQQIKEELNSFKHEMEIHADSRVFTHFF